MFVWNYSGVLNLKIMSGTETASAAAFHWSSEIHTPRTNELTGYGDNENTLGSDNERNS